MSEEDKNNDNKFIVFLKRYWWLLLFIIGGITAGVILSGGDDDGGGGDDSGGGIVDDIDSGMFVFTLVDDDNKGLIVPIMISGNSDSNSVPTNTWFTPGIIKGIEPVFNGSTFSVNLSDSVRPQIQSISFIKSDDNEYLAPTIGTPKQAKQYNFIIMGELTNNQLNLFDLETGISDELKAFRTVDSGITTFNKLKTVVQDNLEFNNYCTDRSNKNGCKSEIL
jgi:hypothetical protein